MLKKLVFFVFLINIIQLYAQNNNSFIGTIQLSDKSIISYQVEFEITDDNSIKGKSVTDFNGAHRTESLIEGRLYNNRKSISFEEIENVNTKSNYDASTFCYVHLTNGRIKLRNKKSIIQGHFLGKYNDGKTCAEGDIYLIGKEFMLNKIRKVEKLLPKEKRSTLNPDAINKSTHLTILQEGSRMKIKTTASTIKLNVWDEQRMDGDEVSIRVNGETVLDHYKIQQEPKPIIVRLEDEVTTIELIADNEGKLPPNTARFSITDYNTTTNIETQLNKNKSAILEITN